MKPIEKENELEIKTDIKTVFNDLLLFHFRPCNVYIINRNLLISIFHMDNVKGSKHKFVTPFSVILNLILIYRNKQN